MQLPQMQVKTVSPLNFDWKNRTNSMLHTDVVLTFESLG